MAVPLCAPCEIKPPSERKLCLPAPGTDFANLISQHFQEMQTQLALDLEKVVNEREHRLQEQIASLRQENDDYRARLRLPRPLDSPTQRANRLIRTGMPTAPLPRGWDGELLAVPEARGSAFAADGMPAFPLQAPGRGMANRQLFTGDWRSRLLSPADLPTALRRLADEQEIVLRGRMQSQSGRLQAPPFGFAFSKDFNPEAWDPTVPSPPMNTSSHVLEADGAFSAPDPSAPSQARPLAVQDEVFQTSKTAGSIGSQQSDAQSMFVSIGSASHLDGYKMFELHSVWLVENKSFADKINDRVTAGLASTHRLPTAETPPRRSSSQFLHTTFFWCQAIHPTSAFGLMWNLIFVVVLSYELIILPLKVFHFDEEGFLGVATWVCIGFWTIDFLLSFCLGFFTSLGAIELRLSATCRHYAMSWMLPDLLVISIDWVSVLDVGSDDGSADSVALVRVGKILRSIRVLRVLRMLRLRKLREACIRFDEQFNSQYLVLIKSIMVNMAALLVFSHFLGCMWYWIGRQEIEGWSSWTMDQEKIEDKGYAYLLSLHWAITMFTPGSMHVQPRNIPERLYSIWVLVVGMILFSSIVSSITAATKSLGSVNARYNGQVWALRRFFREQKISLECTTRVVRYSDYVIKPREHKVALEDVELLRHLPQSLYMDVMFEIYSQHLEGHPFFDALDKISHRVMQAVCCSAISDIYLACDDVLFGPGQTAMAMYVLTEGKMHYEHLERPSTEVEDKDRRRWFCEAVLWTPWVHQGSMVAGKECKLIEIRATGMNGFHEVVSKHRADMKMPKKYGALFVENMNTLAGFDNDDPNDDQMLSDILDPPQEGLSYLSDCLSG